MSDKYNRSPARILHQAENPNPKRQRGAPRYLSYASGWDWCIETRICPTGGALHCLVQKAVARALLVCLAVLFAFCPSANAQFGLNQQRISESQWRRGFHGFNMIVKGNELERITLQEFDTTPPEEVLLIVMGRLGDLPLNITNHVKDGGAALVASDSSLPYSQKEFAGFRFGKLRRYPTEKKNSFGAMPECPLIRDLRTHPILEDVHEIVTNCPGYIWTDDKTTLAWLPMNFRRSRGGGRFIGADEFRNGGRMVAVADQSIFTNQMISYRNNAKFADRTVNWLKGERCTKVLVLVDGSENLMLDPSEVVVNVPPPSQEEVLDALQDIPPSAMLDFANSVATVVEDENMVNDFIHDSMDKVPESAINRFYIYLLFGIACLSFVVAFLFQRKLQGQTASEVAYRRSRGLQVDLKTVQFHERQRAAHFLLDKFCFDMAGTRFGDWPNFPTGLISTEDRESKDIFESMTKMSVLYRSKPTSFWTRKKLAKLENEVNHWIAYFQRQPALATAVKADTTYSAKSAV